MSSGAQVEPAPVVQAVEDYVSSELAQCRSSSNRTPLDDSGVYSLHRLAATIYALGWADGEQSQAERDRGQRRRDREAANSPARPEA